MMRRVIVVMLGSLFVLGILALPASAAPSGVSSNGFETDTAGWSVFNGSSITQRDSSYSNPGNYAVGIPAAAGSHYAGLGRGDCFTQTGGSGDAVECYGPYTDWGNLNSYTWHGPYTTQVDIYLDTAYANANPDTYSGKLAELTAPGGSTDPNVRGTRFDYTSAINSSTPDGNGDAQHLRDFGFNVSTGYEGDGCDGFKVTGQTVVNRINANPNIDNYNPQCVDKSGWYTFKHSFSEKNGHLDVLMEIIPVGTSTAVASWDITADPIADVGCNRYGYFSDQEIFGLPIDNAKIVGGCGAPATPVGKIAPTQTTCQQYRDGAAPDLGSLTYSVKGKAINAVSPGVFFYYGKVSGHQGDQVAITQSNDAGPSFAIPILQKQVVLYNASTCAVLKWKVDYPATGMATGTLPSTGDFIVGVKYNPSVLKGVTAPQSTVVYTFGGTGQATVSLLKK